VQHDWHPALDHSGPGRTEVEQLDAGLAQGPGRAGNERLAVDQGVGQRPSPRLEDAPKRIDPPVIDGRVDV
jgi:hypothetical protein